MTIYDACSRFITCRAINRQARAVSKLIVFTLSHPTANASYRKYGDVHYIEADAIKAGLNEYGCED
jgi:hypothetical protein